MTFTILIPARLASTRLPNKPLADIGGAPMVVRVAQRVMSIGSPLGKVRVVVAADSAKIISACLAHNVPVGILAVGSSAATRAFASGYSLVVTAIDVSLFSRAATDLVRAINPGNP